MANMKMPFARDGNITECTVHLVSDRSNVSKALINQLEYSVSVSRVRKMSCGSSGVFMSGLAWADHHLLTTKRVPFLSVVAWMASLL